MKVVNAMLWMWGLRVFEFFNFYTLVVFIFVWKRKPVRLCGVCMSESCIGRLKYEDWTQAATDRGLIALCYVGWMILISKRIPSRKKSELK